MAQSISVEQAKELIERAKPLFDKDSDEAMLEILSLSIEAYMEVERDFMFEMDTLTNYIARAFYMYLTSRYYQYAKGLITFEDFGYKVTVKYNSMGVSKTVEVNKDFINKMFARSESIGFSDVDREVLRVARIHVETFETNFNIYKNEQNVQEPATPAESTVSVSANLSNKKKSPKKNETTNVDVPFASEHDTGYRGDERYRSLTKDMALAYLEELVPKGGNLSVSKATNIIERTIEILRNQRKRSPQVEIFACKDVIAPSFAKLFKRHYEKLLKQLRETGSVDSKCMMVLPINDVMVGKVLLFVAGHVREICNATAEICTGVQSKKDIENAKAQTDAILSEMADVFLALINECNARGIILYDHVKGQNLNQVFARVRDNSTTPAPAPVVESTPAPDQEYDVRLNLVQNKRSDSTKRDTTQPALSNTTPRNSTPTSTPANSLASRTRPVANTNEPEEIVEVDEVEEIENEETTYASNTHRGFFTITTIWLALISIVSLLAGVVLYNYVNDTGTTLQFGEIVEMLVLESQALLAQYGLALSAGEILGILPLISTRLLVTGVAGIVASIVVSRVINKYDCRQESGTNKYYFALILMAVAGLPLTTLVNLCVYNSIMKKYSGKSLLTRIIDIIFVVAIFWLAGEGVPYLVG